LPKNRDQGTARYCIISIEIGKESNLCKHVSRLQAFNALKVLTRIIAVPVFISISILLDSAANVASALRRAFNEEAEE